MDKNILLEEIKNAIQIDGNFKNEVLNTLSIKIIDKDEAYRIISKVLTTFNLYVNDVFFRADKILFSNHKFIEFVCDNIGLIYFRDFHNHDKGILNALNEICSKTNEEDYKSFIQYFKENYPDRICLDVFELRDKVLEKVNNE